jgi:hypothetical protein
MFFLSLDITSNLCNLRFAHGERAVSFLPREPGRVFECARNPGRRVRFQFPHQFRERFVLSQFRKDVDVIGSPIHNQCRAAFGPDGTAKIFVNSRPNRGLHPRFAVLRGKHNVIQQIAIGRTHTEGPFRRPCPGALLLLHSTPGVSLRSTPRFNPPHPSGALTLMGCCSCSRRLGPAPSAPEARRSKAPSGAKRNSGREHSNINETPARGDGPNESCRTCAHLEQPT